MKKNILTIIILLAAFKIYAQPANDDCQFAQSVFVPESGSICFSGSNISATPDAVAPNACNGPTGGNEIWYTFVTTGTTNTITVNPGVIGGAQTVSITVPNGSCSAASLVCNTSATTGGSAFVNFSVPIGTQVWFEVTSLTADGLFDICVISLNNVPPWAANSGDSCVKAIRLCNKQSFTGNYPAIFANSGQQISCYAFPAAYLSDIWYKFTVAKTGTFGFICTPQLGLDIDWEVLDITAGCPGLLPAACCNNIYNGAGGDPTGMDASSGTPCGGASHIVTPIVVTAGNTYAIHLNYTTASTNTYTMTFSGTFEIAPFPDFTVDDPSGCAPLATDFTDASFAASTYTWTFGNGNTSTGNNPAVQNYAAPGNYLTTLTVTDAATGCVNATSQNITVDNPPTSTFTATPTPVCVNTDVTVTYTGTGSAAATYNWNFNGGTIMSGTGQGPYTIQWATAGVKNITLDVTENGCTSASTSISITVTTAPTSTFTLPAGACTGDSVLVAYTGTGTSSGQYFYGFGNAFVIGTPSYDSTWLQWGSPGLDSVTLLVYEGGCQSTLTTMHYITIGTKPTSTFTLTDTICSSQQAIATYTGNGSGTATYNWTYGGGVASPGGTTSGPQSITYASPGFHPVTLIVDETGCQSGVTTDSVFVVTAPTSTFTVSDDSLCGSETAVITYTGTGTGAAVFNWNLGSANIISGSGSGPYTVNYATAGLNYITLDVTENTCTSLIKKDSILVADVPVANAGTDVTYCSGDSAQIGAGVAVIGYQYAWTPPASVNQPTYLSPYAIVNNTGTTIKSVDLILTVTNQFCIDKDTVNVKVYPKQIANIVVTPSLVQCLDVNHFNFTNNATTVPGGTFNWNFTPSASTATATTSTVNNITYATPGNYLVTLITTTSANCPNDSDKVTITVNDGPIAGFYADTLIGCPPLTINFTDTSKILPGCTYLWDFGNGTTSTYAGDTATEYTSGGSYTVSLTITSPSGCTSEATHSNLITVTDAPVASFTADPLVTNILSPVITFTSTSLNTDTCLYLFGDGGTSSDCATKYGYADTGTYVVTLIVSNAGGCTDTAYETVTIEDFYTIYFPNSFTPNSDGVNDLYFVTGFGVSTFQIRIFNNRGQQIFVGDNINFTWTGLDENGDKVPEGNYVYEAQIKDVLGKKHTRSGGIVVLR